MSTEVSTRERIASLTNWTVPIVAIATILASLLGVPWQFIPAQPASHMPELNLTFSDLQTASETSISPIQRAYFGGLIWVLIVLSITLALTAVKSRTRTVEIAEAAVAAVALVFTVLACKGPSTWSEFIQSIPNLRLGGYLFIIGLMLLLVHGLAELRKRNVAETLH